MIPRYLLAAALILGASAPAASQSVTAGIDAWQKGNYASAVAIWRPLALAGNADAQFNLGQAYRLGRGVPAINLTLAKQWLEKAAAQGHVDAETTLGLLLFQNGEQAVALKWLKLAAEAAEPRAMLIYGTALFNGDSVTQNHVLGYSYVYRANASGLAAAKDILGQLDKLTDAADRKEAMALVRTKDKEAANAIFKPARPPKPAPTAAAKPVKVPVAKLPKPARVETAEASKPAPKPAAKPVAGAVSGNWRIQVGAFNNRASAEAAWRKLAGNAALAGRSPQYIPFQQFIRLRVGPFASQGSAAAACTALRVACYPVAPGK